MNFLHLSLLAGLALAALPIVIHFSGRRQPKRVAFPTLRFVTATKTVSAKGWSIKRWLLLILRMLMLGLFALAFASPRVHGSMLASWLGIGLISVLALIAMAATVLAFIRRSSTSGVRYTALFLSVVLGGIALLWSGWVIARGPSTPMQATSGPVAAVLIIDTSPSMDYRFENETRLEKAKDTARWILNRLDNQSKIAVLTDSYSDRLQLGHAAAETEIQRLQIEYRPVDLQERIKKAIELVRASDLERREIYVLTDLSVSSWSDQDAKIDQLLGTGNLGNENQILLQVADVGLPTHRNWAIDQVRISQQVATVGGSVQVNAKILAAESTPAEQVIVELRAEAIDPSLPMLKDDRLVAPEESLLDRKIVDSPGKGDLIDVNFTIDNLPLGTNHFALQLATGDPLSIDNRWPFTIEGTAGGQVTVVAWPDPKRTTAQEEAATLMLMMDPNQVGSQTKTAEEFERVDLEAVGVVALYNPPARLSARTIARLDKFVTIGGGLLIVLGDAIDVKALETGSPETNLATLLPGPIKRLTRDSSEQVFIENVDLNNGLWREFGQDVRRVPWTKFPIHRHWDLEEMDEAAKPIARYTVSGLPAIIEQIRGQGRVITYTTTVPDFETPQHEAWNELSSSSEFWVGFGTMLGTSRYLQTAGATARNFESNQAAFVQWGGETLPKQFDLFSPDGTLEPVQINDQSLFYGFTKPVGHYRLKGRIGVKNYLRGFSIQMPVGATDLHRVEASDLDRYLGVNNYALATDRESLRESIGQGRYGRDLTPFLLLVVAGIFFAEQAMSQHYYGSTAGIATAGRK